MLGANRDHMLHMDRRTAEFVRFVREEGADAEIRCTFYADIAANEQHPLSEWMPWYERNAQLLIDLLDFRPQTGIFSGQPVVKMLLAHFPDATTMYNTTSDDDALAEKMSTPCPLSV
eukprot:COSAG02_NODE_2375_length_9016_cov_3.763598_3_plen_117_part_00